MRISGGSIPGPPSGNAANFDHLAHLYRWLEYLSFGPFLWRTRTHFLPRLMNSPPLICKALILGDGDGRFTARLLRLNPSIEIHAVDASSEMLRSLQKEAGRNARRVTVEVADLRRWQPGSEVQYDLIATHFFLDCLTTQEVTDLALRLIPVATPHTRWLVSEFAIPSTHFGRLIAAPVIAMLYRVFRALTGLRLRRLPDHHLALAQADWTLQASHTRLRGLLISELWSRGTNPNHENEPPRTVRPSLQKKRSMRV